MQHLKEFDLAIKMMIALLEFVLSVIPDGLSVVSILINYHSLCDLCEEYLGSPVWLEPDVKARIIGIKALMTKFNFLFGLKICEHVLKQTDNLSRALQKSSLSAAEAQHIASLIKDRPVISIVFYSCEKT